MKKLIAILALLPSLCGAVPLQVAFNAGERTETLHIQSGTQTHSSWTNGYPEASSEDGTTWISSSVSTLKESFPMDDTTLTTITSLTCYHKQRYLTAGVAKGCIASGAVWDCGSNYSLTSSFTFFSTTWTVDPNTSSAWTQAGINAIQSGTENVSGTAHEDYEYCTVTGR